MRFQVLAIGQRMPNWVQTGWSEYQRRFPRGISLELREIPALRRNRNADISSIRQKEGDLILAATGRDHIKIALDENGRQWTTSKLSSQMKKWMQSGQNVDFMIGGPDGLSEPCLKAANKTWSLGLLTLPHPLVRVVLAEQLYRAWSMTQNHPYHRE